MKRRILCAALALVLCLGLLPASALAEGTGTNHTVIVGGARLTVCGTNQDVVTYAKASKDGVEILETGEDANIWLFDWHGNAYMFLIDADIPGAAWVKDEPHLSTNSIRGGAGIYCDEALTINLIGDNKVGAVHYEEGQPNSCMAIGAWKGLTICSDEGGTLEASCENVTLDNGDPVGIYSGGALTVSGSAEVTAKGGGGVYSSCGAQAVTSITVSDNAKLTGIGGPANSSIGISCDTMSVYGNAEVNCEAYSGKMYSEGLSFNTGDSHYLSISDNGKVTSKTGGSPSQYALGMDVPYIGTNRYFPIYLSGNAQLELYADAGSSKSCAFGSNPIQLTYSGGTLIASSKTELCLNKSYPGLTIARYPEAHIWRTDPDGNYKFSEPNRFVYQHPYEETYLEITQGYQVTTSCDGTMGTTEGSGWYKTGTEVKVNALPSAGYQFAGWMEGSSKVSDEAEYSFTIGSDRTLAAEFEAIPVSGITLSQDSLNLLKDETGKLTADVQPPEALDRTVTWSSSDPDVATVDGNGTVTAVGAGTATITAAAGECKAECTVTVQIHTLTSVDGQPATCTEAGYKDYYKCSDSDCGKLFADSNAKTEIEDLEIWKSGKGKIDALGHDWGEWETTEEAACLEAGVQTRTCKRDSGHIETKEIPALGHDWGAWEATKEATCLEAGVQTRTCNRDSSHTETEEIPATGHNWDKANWSSDDTSHWHECLNPGCPITGNSEKDNYVPHVYENDADAVCNDCGYKREAHAVTGAVTDRDGNNLKDVTVILRKGKDIAETITDANGQYTFPTVTPGSYNVVAIQNSGSADEKIMTHLVTISGEDATGQDLTMPSDGVNSVLEVKEDSTHAVVVGGLEAEAEEVKKDAGEDAKVTVTMTVEEKKEEDAPNADEIKAKAGSRTLDYLEIKVQKTVEQADASGQEPEAIPTTKSLLEIVISFNFAGKNKESVQVYRYHGSGVDVLPKTKTGDNEYIELGTDSITLHVKNFSTYAIGYTNADVEPVEPEPEPEPEPAPAPAPGPGVTSCTVTASAGEGGSITPSGSVSVVYGGSKDFTITPDEGYEISDVLVDGESVGAVSTYTFEKVSKNHKIEAVFKKSEGWETCPGGESCPVSAFTDLSPSAWYHDGIHYCLENGLMVGTTETTFEPDTTTSRAMIATILWRLQGSPAVNYAMSFKDVDEGEWYTEAIRWAASERIVTGYGGGSFGPDDPITREQLAVMLYRCEQKYGGGGFTGSWSFLLDFTDRDQISEWAYEALCWTTMNKIIEGRGDKVLDPQGKATRAEAAAMIQRYCETERQTPGAA